MDYVRGPFCFCTKVPVIDILTIADSPGLNVFLDTPTSCLMGAVTPVGHDMYTCTTCRGVVT